MSFNKITCSIRQESNEDEIIHFTLPDCAVPEAIHEAPSLKIPENDLCSISHHKQSFESNLDVPLLTPQEFLGLQFNLSTRLEYSINGEPCQTILKNQYVLAYIPEGATCQFHLQKGAYISLSVQLTYRYLDLFAGQFPILKDFLRSVRSKDPAVLSKTPLPINSEIFQIINNILTNRFTGTCRDEYLQAKIFSLLWCCLEHVTMCTAPVRKPSAKVVEVRNYLLQNLQYPCSVSLLADKVEMPKRKLEKKFRQYTGTTIYNFLIQERMKKAETLLRNTEMPAKEIAVAVGYKKPSNFTEAFKKKYGYLPSLLRQRYISLDQPKLPDISL